MAKRFIDTGIFHDSWFSELKPTNKLFYIYLFTKCDHAGVIDLNPRFAEFETGIKGLSNCLETVNEDLGNRLLRLRDNYYILPKFLKFQYPKGLNINVKAQKSVINRLSEFNLDYELLTNSLETVSKQLRESYLTPQDKDKDKDKDTDIDTDRNGVVRGKESDEGLSFEDFWDLYDKKVGAPQCKEKWNNLSQGDRKLIMEYIPEYKLAQPNKQYRKNPETFLNQKSWNDELQVPYPFDQFKYTGSDASHDDRLRGVTFFVDKKKGKMFELDGKESSVWFWDGDFGPDLKEDH